MTASATSVVGLVAIALCFCAHDYARGGKDELKCESLHPLAGSQSKYQKRDNRCEGLYVNPVSVESLGAISFTLGKLKFENGPKIRLEVSTPDKTGPINIRSVAIPPRTYYRMDARLNVGSVLVWPVGDVLFPEKLGDSRIGVFGWKGPEDDKTLVPVAVTPQGVDSADKFSKPPLLSFRTSFDTQLVRWRWAASNGGQCLRFGAWQVVANTVTAGSPVTIDLSKLPVGLHCVEVAAESSTSNTPSMLDLRVEIPPR